ncbi:MAG: MBL fold metallo-hydrolase [Candidatus Gracilibacteria bacterium]|nr:MBL fold metallo-hydrolase [Candidatus Gracilibacteria bacterium]
MVDSQENRPFSVRDRDLEQEERESFGFSVEISIMHSILFLDKKSMLIHPLGHTEFGIEIENKQGETVRILVDAWLSNYAFGDLMERTPRWKLDSEKLSLLDVVYLSHSHCDHFDPYTLVPLYRVASPILLIPETLAYLVPVIDTHIPQAHVHILRNRETFTYAGIDFHGICFDNEAITNEDDVMTLAVSNHEEIIYAEIDTLIPKTEEAYDVLTRLFNRKPYAQVTYLSSRNELGANLPILDLDTEQDREKFRKQYRSSRKEELEWEYEMLISGELSDFTEVPNFARGFIGQGICYPSLMDPLYSKIGAMSLIDISELETSIAKKYGKDFPSRVLTPGKVFKTTASGLKPIQMDSFIGTIMTEHISESPTDLGRIYAQGPLRDDMRDFVEQESILLYILNNRFLPSVFSNPDDNLKTAILKNPERVYRIAVRFGTSINYQTRTYVFSFRDSIFHLETRGEYTEGNNICQEDYWMNDLEDFWNGTQELYSNFFHLLDPKRTYRLWNMLGANFFNHDIVKRKYEYHFARAIQGETGDDFVEEIYRGLRGGR